MGKLPGVGMAVLLGVYLVTAGLVVYKSDQGKVRAAAVYPVKKTLILQDEHCQVWEWYEEVKPMYLVECREGVMGDVGELP